MIKVSICCITYNHAPFIRQCLDGFLMQQCDFEYEILIHDDASTDGTIQIIHEYVEKYPRIIKPIIQKENQYSKGVRGFNFLYNFPRAKGVYLAICEGDDCWIDPNKLNRQVSLLDKHPELSFCSHNVSRIDQSGAIIQQVVSNDQISFYKPRDVFREFFPTLSLVFRNVKFDYGGELKYAFNGDAVLVALLANYGGGCHMGFEGAYYRVHTGGVFSTGSYAENSIKSLITRVLLRDSGKITGGQLNALKNEISRRKIKIIKHALKKLNFKLIINVLKIK